MKVGEVLKILATDRGAIADFPAWVEDTGHEILEWHDEATWCFTCESGKATHDLQAVSVRTMVDGTSAAFPWIAARARKHVRTWHVRT